MRSASGSGAGTEVIDLGGKLVLPGFNDAHVHFFSGGENLAGVQLRDAKSEAEFRERIAEFAAKQPAGRWITGGDWDHENWTPARLPTRQLIDAVQRGPSGLRQPAGRPHGAGQLASAETGGHHARYAGPARRHHRARRGGRAYRRVEGCAPWSACIA